MTSPNPEPGDALDLVASDTLPPDPHDDAPGADAGADVPGDEWLRDLPEEALAWMVRSLPTRELWEWLGDKARGNLRLVMLAGFRAVPANLKQLSVTKKLVAHTGTHPEILRGLVDLWRGGRAPLFEAISERDDDALLEILPALLHSHGEQALLLALAATGRHQALEALPSLSGDEPNSDSGEEKSTRPEGTQPPEESAAGSSPESAEEGRLRESLDEVKERESKLQAALRTGLERAEKERDKALARARDADRALKAAQNKSASLEKERDELQKLLDRTERRGRQAERAKDELEADAKKLKRQVRRQQEISEELRKQLASAHIELEGLRPQPAPTAAISPTPPASTWKPAPKATSRPDAELDREYVLKADGRKVSVTARQVQERVDANDEEWVFGLIQALEAIAQVDAAGHRKFLDALKPLGFYYRRVLTTDTLRVLVDASNVVRFEKDHLGKGRLKYLLDMRTELRRRDCFPIKLVADASLPYFIDDPAELASMARRGEVEMAVPGQEADEILAREARRTGAYVVTNDRLFFQKATPDFEPPRITFRVIEGHVIVDEF